MRRGRPRGSASPGVKYGPLTPVELGILLALSEGMTPKKIAAETRIKNVRTIWKCVERIKLKLGVLTRYEMMFKVGKERIIE